jgi:hypothetical protein
VKRIAIIDASTANDVNQVLASTEALNLKIAALSEEQRQVGRHIETKEEERKELQALLEEKEASYARLQSSISEMDKVGSELLDSVLMGEDPPTGSNPLEVLVAWGHQLIADAGGDLGDFPLAPLLTEDFIVDVPWAAFALIMSRIHIERTVRKTEVEAIVNDVEAAPSLLVAMYERITASKSLVNADQLKSQQRGLLLLFLAGLMRFSSNWLVCRPPLKTRAGASSGSGVSFNESVEQPFAESSTGDPRFMTFTAHLAWANKVRQQQRWVVASMSALHTALEISTHRPPILTSDEQEDLALFLSVPMIRIVDILPKSGPNAFFISLMKSMQHVFSDLRKVYLAYAVPSLAYPDVVRLAKDCKLIDPKKMSKTDILAMCLEVWGGDRKGGTDGTEHTAPESSKRLRKLGSDLLSKSRREAAADAADITTRVLEPRHFTELIFRMALSHSRRISKESRDEISIPIVTGFITEAIAPHALRSDVDRFRQIVRHPQVRVQLSKYRPQLMRVFKRFAKQDDGQSMSRQQFFDMSTECKWHSKTVTSDVLADIYKRCQVPDQATMLESLDFHEWFEALVAVALYSDPNPLVPAYQKLPPFIEDRILLPLQI